eukprot:7390565-Prymnesium_polylepis.1
MLAHPHPHPHVRLTRAFAAERSHGGGGAREGAGSKPGEARWGWTALTEEAALALGLGWGQCKKCGKEGAVSFNGATCNTSRPVRPSFTPTGERWNRRHQCPNGCGGDYITK